MRHLFRRYVKKIALTVLRDLQSWKWGLIVLIVYFGAMKNFLYSLCPVVMLTGFPCPACGMTRAGALLLKLNPAADCPGINMTLTIKKDKTFELISEYIDRQDATFKEYGTYSVEGNIMTLINGEDKQYYKVGENTLTALNQDKQAITGELADHYILHKK